MLWTTEKNSTRQDRVQRDLAIYGPGPSVSTKCSSVSGQQSPPNFNHSMKKAIACLQLEVWYLQIKVI
jgi:hypothetical protein